MTKCPTFRAKIAQDISPDYRKGDWVTGFPLKDYERDKWLICAPPLHGGAYDAVPVDENTIGISTGKRDCKGVMIFEGDILSEHDDAPFRYDDSGELENSEVGIVVYETPWDGADNPGFYVHAWTFADEFWIDDNGVPKGYDGYGFPYFDYHGHIIGNIHDSPPDFIKQKLLEYESTVEAEEHGHAVEEAKNWKPDKRIDRPDGSWWGLSLSAGFQVWYFFHPEWTPDDPGIYGEIQIDTNSRYIYCKCVGKEIDAKYNLTDAYIEELMRQVERKYWEWRRNNGNQCL